MATQPLQARFAPCIVEKNKRPQYYAALQATRLTGDITKLAEFLRIGIVRGYQEM